MPLGVLWVPAFAGMTPVGSALPNHTRHPRTDVMRAKRSGWRHCAVGFMLAIARVMGSLSAASAADISPAASSTG
jgi:hypothetical protein